jgi:PAS domain S-box-containing protein
VISDLARAASEAQSPVHLAGLIVTSTCQLVAADSAALYLWAEASDQLRLACSSESAVEIEPLLAPPEGLASQAFARQQPILVSDYSTWRKGARSFEPAGFQVAAAVPLRTHHRNIGSLVVRFRSADADPSLLDILSLVSMVVSAPLEAAELRDRLREEEKLDGALRRMTQALAAHENEGRVLWLATRYAAQLLGAPVARLWLLEDDGGFVCAAAEGYLEPDPIGMRLPPDCLCGQVISGGAQNLADATADPAWHPAPAVEQAGVRAYLGAPMRRAGRLLGVLSVMRGTPFERAAEHLITILADAAAAAVDNARALARSQALARNLAEIQQRYTLLFEHSPVTVLGLDEQGRVTSVNPAWERLSGHSGETAIGSPFESLVVDTNAPAAQGFHGPFRVEVTARDLQLLDRQGRHLDVRATRMPVLIESRLVGGYEFLEDVSERQRADETLRRRARQQSALGDVALWALTGADLDELLQASANALATALDAEFATLFELDSSTDTLTLRAAGGLAHDLTGQVQVATGLASQAGYTLLHQTDPVIVDDMPAERRFSPGRHLLSRGALSGLSVVISGRGHPFGVLAVHSLRRQAFTPQSAAYARTFAQVLGLAITCRGLEEALYRREQEVTALVEHIPDVVFRLDNDLRFTFVNSCIEWVTGCPAASFIGAGVEAMGVSENMLQLLQLRFRHVFRSGRAQAFDLPLDGPAGQHDYETHLIPELAQDGSVESVLAIARDVTERRRIEAHREEQQRQLLAREERLEELLEQVVAAQAVDQRRRAEVAKLEPLSARELQVMRLLANGWTNAEIALELLVSPGTVKNHVSRILPKLGAVDRTQAAARAVELGLLSK